MAIWRSAKNDCVAWLPLAVLRRTLLVASDW